MSRKLLSEIQQHFAKGEFGLVVASGPEVLERIKNRHRKRYLCWLIALSCVKLKQYKKAANYVLTAPKTEEKLRVVHFLASHILDVDILESFLKQYPDDQFLISMLVNASICEDKYDKWLYYSAQTDFWGLIGGAMRENLIWNNLYEFDRLFKHELDIGHLDYRPMPLVFLAMHNPLLSQKDLRKCIELVVSPIYESYLSKPALVEGFERKKPRPRGKKLKIGYLSADFHSHATMLLLARTLELHDRDKYEIHLFVLNEMTKHDKMCQRIWDMGFEMHYFHDRAKDIDIEKLAQSIYDQKIDILVDLKGYTEGGKTQVCALRPAPIIVNWLGFPNTFGIERLADYIITDKIVTPLSLANGFTETFAYMPHCYQPNDNSIEVDFNLTRADVGLPEDKVVFCSFNGLHKLNPEQLSYWCQLLRDVPDSVLWILEPSRSGPKYNLLQEIKARDVDLDRIIFAPRLPSWEHRRRLSLADIALDSFPCTSHTTASDLMFACVPLISQLGNTFCSRVSASVVSANNCPELVARNLEEAYSLAYNLATNKELLAAVKEEMRHNYKHSPLYDSETFTRNLERLYERMWQQYEAGKKDLIDLEQDLS